MNAATRIASRARMMIGLDRAPEVPIPADAVERRVTRAEMQALFARELAPGLGRAA